MPEEPSVSLVERIALRDAIDALPEKERKTILLRFFKGLTQEQTARILQISQVQVSRLERRSLPKAAGPAGRGVTSGRDGVKREASRQQRDFECKMDQDRGGSIAERSSRYRRDGRSLVTER